MGEWHYECLGGLCDVIGGGTPSKEREDFYAGAIPWATVRDMKGEVITATEFRITPEAVAASATNVIPAGNVVIATRVGLGKVCVLAQDTAINQDLRGIVPRDKRLDARYLYWWLRSVAPVIVAEGTGATVQGVKLPFIKGLRVPVPPLAEQQRIVAILDEAFAGIATAKANAEKALCSIRRLVDARLFEIFAAAESRWPTAKLGDAAELARGGSPRPIKSFLTDAADGINWVKIGDASASEKYIFSTREKIKPAGASRSRVVHDGDFLLSNSMSFGRPYIMRTTGCIHDGWLVLSNYADSFNQDFLYRLLGSQHVYRQFDRLAAGSTVRNLNIDLAASVTVPVPPLEEQESIARELDALEVAVRQGESVYQRKLAALDELKQSLLHRAFSGQL